MPMRIYNAHLHVLTSRAVPKKFLKLGLVRLLARNSITRPLGRVLNLANPWSSDDLFERYSRFMRLSAKCKAKDVFDYVSGFYPVGSRFVLLPMDLQYMEEKPFPDADFEQTYEAQLEELAEMKEDEDYKDIVFPFVAVDPRRGNVLELVKEYIGKRGFTGIKIYPTLGYLPYDSRLSEVYAYCETLGKPVISHVSHGPVHYRDKVTDEMLAESAIDRRVLDSFPEKDRHYFFTHPLHYGVLAERFPKLRIDMAHFGGEGEWDRYLDDSWRLDDPDMPVWRQSWFSLVLDLIKGKNRNLYADIAYTLCDPKYQPLLHAVLQDDMARSQILFGSDFYMVQQEASERAFALDLRAALGEADFRQIAETNPKRFLFAEECG